MARFGDLDTSYGIAAAPGYIDKHEIDHTPLSLIRLDPEYARILGRIMTFARSDRPIVSLPFQWLYFLWLIDESGELLVAYEELLAANMLTPNRRFARQRDVGIPSDLVRLGHPSMVRGAPARIGGELLYDYRDNAWTLNNKSGRTALDGQDSNLKTFKNC